MTEQAYTVLDKERVKSALNIKTAPVGLYVRKIGNKKSCAVDIVPPSPNVDSLRVSDSLLQELLEDGAIEQKINEAQ